MLVLRAREVVLLHVLRLPQLGDHRLQALLGLSALAHVANADAYAFVLAARVVNRPPVGRRPEFRAVLAPRPELVILAGVAAQPPPDLAHGALDVALADERRRKVRHRDALCRGVTE